MLYGFLRLLVLALLRIICCLAHTPFSEGPGFLLVSGRVLISQPWFEVALAGVENPVPG